MEPTSVRSCCPPATHTCNRPSLPNDVRTFIPSLDMIGRKCTKAGLSWTTGNNDDVTLLKTARGGCSNVPQTVFKYPLLTKQTNKGRFFETEKSKQAASTRDNI